MASKKELPKKNVLWVIHTTGRPEEMATLKFQDSFIGKDRKILPSQTISIYGSKPRDRIDMFYDGLINAMKIAQKNGMAIVMEGPMNTPLMERAKKEGVDVSSIKSIYAPRGGLKKFFKKQGIKPGHFFVAGHYRERCVVNSAKALRRNYPKSVSLLLGTPSFRAKLRPAQPQEYAGFGIASLSTLRTQKTLWPSEKTKPDMSYIDYIRSLKGTKVGEIAKKRPWVRRR